MMRMAQLQPIESPQSLQSHLPQTSEAKRTFPGIDQTLKPMMGRIRGSDSSQERNPGNHITILRTAAVQSTTSLEPVAATARLPC